MFLELAGANEKWDVLLSPNGNCLDRNLKTWDNRLWQVWIKAAFVGVFCATIRSKCCPLSDKAPLLRNALPFLAVTILNKQHSKKCINYLLCLCACPEGQARWHRTEDPSHFSRMFAELSLSCTCTPSHIHLSHCIILMKWSNPPIFPVRPPLELVIAYCRSL